MFNEELKHSPKNTGGIFSPRFKSVAAMAGWDEETLLVASLVVEDTPDRESKYKKRSDSQFKTPRSNSRRYIAIKIFHFYLLFCFYSKIYIIWFD